MDDGCDLVSLLHRERTGQLAEVLAGTEETTTGVIRLRAMAADGALRFPVVAVNEAQTKHLFDNRYGTGQSTLDGILRATNILIAGRNVVVAGYGWVGKGIAVADGRPRRPRGDRRGRPGPRARGAHGRLPGHDRRPRPRAWGELFITATGNVNVFRREHFAAMRDGAIMANSGHFDAELDLVALRELAEGHVREVRENVQEFDLGRQAAPPHRRGPARQPRRRRGPPGRGDGHELRQPGAVGRVRRGPPRRARADRVYVVPEAIDAEVARLKLDALGIELEPMTDEQAAYVASWQHGT